jgi:hypothetical protein
VVTRERLGIAVSGEFVRGVLLQRGLIVWHLQVPVEQSGGLLPALMILIRAAPIRRPGRTIAVAAIGPSSAIARRISGVSDSAKAEEIEGAIRLDPLRFFRFDAKASVTSGVQRRGRAWWCAVVLRSALAAVEEACRTQGIRLHGCAPTTVLLGGALRNGVVLVRDGEITEEATVSDGTVVNVRPVLARGEEISSEVVPALAIIGPHAGRFADAYAAATDVDAGALLVDQQAADRRGRRQVRLRIALAASLILSCAGATFAPSVRAQWSVRTATRRAEAAAHGSPRASEAALRLAAASADTRRVREFASSRRTMIGMFQRLAEALPESTALVSLRVDSTAVSMVTVSPIGRPIIPDLRRLPEFASAQLVGAVTREANTALQRASVRLSFKRRSVGVRQSATPRAQ